MQCDRSAVGAWRPAVPRVARRLVALAPARPTAILSTAPRSRNRPLRGRGIDRSAVAESTAPRSRNRPLRGRGIDRSAVAESTAPRSRNRPLRGKSTETSEPLCSSVCSVLSVREAFFAQPTSCRRRPTIAVTSSSAARPRYTSGIPADSAASLEPMKSERRCAIERTDVPQRDVERLEQRRPARPRAGRERHRRDEHRSRHDRAESCDITLRCAPSHHSRRHGHRQHSTGDPRGQQLSREGSRR